MRRIYPITLGTVYVHFDTVLITYNIRKKNPVILFVSELGIPRSLAMERQKLFVASQQNNIVLLQYCRKMVEGCCCVYNMLICSKSTNSNNTKNFCKFTWSLKFAKTFKSFLQKNKRYIEFSI